MNSHRYRQLLAFAIMLLLAVAWVTPAEAQSGAKARANDLLAAGNKLLQDGQHANALEKFKAAYDVYPSPAILLNIGTTLRVLGRHAEAANTYSRWMRAKRSPDHVAEVEEALKELDKKVARLTINVSEKDATIKLNGRTLNQEQLKTIVRVDPGPHSLAVSKSGFKPSQKDVVASAGNQQTVEFTLERIAGESAPDEVVPPIGEPVQADQPSDGGSGGRGLRIAGLSVAAVGLLSVGAAVKFGLDSKNISNELDDEGGKLTDMGQPWTAELLAKQSDGESAQTKMIIFAAVGGAAIVGGGILFALGHAAKSDTPNEGLAIAPTLTPTTIGWVVAGSF